MKGKRRLAIVLFAGGLFGAGLALSGMTNPYCSKAEPSVCTNASRCSADSKCPRSTVGTVCCPAMRPFNQTGGPDGSEPALS